MKILTNLTAVHDAGLEASAATSDVEGNVIDMDGAEGIECTAIFGTAAAGGLKAQTGTLANGSDMADLAGSAVTAGAGKTVVRLCVHKAENARRYVRFVAERPSSTTVLAGVAHRYGLRQTPPPTTGAEDTSKVVVGAGDGTA